MNASSSDPELLTQGLVEELYRRRAVLGLVAAMALILAATAIGFRVWAPGGPVQAEADLAEIQSVPTSSPAVGRRIQTETPELWVTPNSASGAKVWVRANTEIVSSTTFGG